jgi:hypothetical protein
MRMTMQEDIAATDAEVFAAATDVAAFERQALRRGIQVRRLDGGAGLAPGAAWEVRAPYRGREREIRITVTRVTVPTTVAARIEIGGLRAESVAEIVALSRQTTRLALAIDLEATSLTSRLMLQSFRLARGSIEKRLGGRVSAWARGVEARRPR